MNCKLFSICFIIQVALAVEQLQTPKISLAASSNGSRRLSNGDFTADIFGRITKTGGKSNENLIFSPASIQSCLALAFVGAEGKTANELVTGLHFNTSNKTKIVRQFENMLKATRGPNSLLKIANKIYAIDSLQIKEGFNEFAKKSFDSEAELIDFRDNQRAVNRINNWVAENTNNQIKNLVDTQVIKPDTRMVLVNAIHFKGNWLYPLKLDNGEFLNNGNSAKETQMMFIKEEFLYALLNELNAKAVKMPYANSDLSLMLILPYEKTGLWALEDKLKSINLIDLNDRFMPSSVDIRMPKFKIESQLELKNILEDMGMETMFTDRAEFNFFTSSSESSKIKNVLHKATIDVDEFGTEAGAATGTTIGFKSIYEDFNADHPFFFAILDKSNVYFTGHLINV